MTSERSENYAAHAVDVLDSVQLLRSEEIAFDFMIIVDEETFHAHRMILVACSDYYRAMFSHNTKEVLEGKVEMKGVQAHAFKQCLDFMYSGKFQVTLETAEDILCAADILQMKKVSKLSFDYLSENLEDENCIFVMKLLEIYPCEALVLKAKEHLRRNFTTVVHSDGFRQLSLADSKEYLTEYGNDDESKWEGAVSWLEYDTDEREPHILQFVELLDLKEFPSEKMLKSMWNQPCFAESKECTSILIHRLFSDIADLESNISATTSFFLRQQAESYEHITKEANEVIFTCLKKNLDRIMANDEFLKLSKQDVLSLFQAEDVEYLTPESSRWNAMVRWLKANENHQDVFPELFDTVKFDFLSMEFIKNTVRSEALVKKFSECHEALIDIIAMHKQTLKHSIVMLFFDGSLKKLDVSNKSWSTLPNVSVTKNSVKSLVCLNGNLCFLNGQRLLHLTKSNAWVEKSQLSHLPDAKAQVVACLGSLYVVEKSAVARYDPDQNTWAEDLLGCKFDKFTIAASENYIYAMVHDVVQKTRAKLSVGNAIVAPIQVKRYDPTSDMWSYFCSSPYLSYAHILVADSRLYAMNDCEMKCLDPRTGQWIARTKHKTVSSSCTFLEVCGKVTMVGTSQYDAVFKETYDYNNDAWIRTQLPEDEPTTSAYILPAETKPSALPMQPTGGFSFVAQPPSGFSSAAHAGRPVFKSSSPSQSSGFNFRGASSLSSVKPFKAQEPAVADSPATSTSSSESEDSEDSESEDSDIESFGIISSCLYREIDSKQIPHPAKYEI